METPDQRVGRRIPLVKSPEILQPGELLPPHRVTGQEDYISYFQLFSPSRFRLVEDNTLLSMN
jgi:hypothetical protein